MFVRLDLHEDISSGLKYRSGSEKMNSLLEQNCADMVNVMVVQTAVILILCREHKEAYGIYKLC